MPSGEVAVDEPVFPDLRIPLYLTEEEPLTEAKRFMREYDLEAPVEFDASMGCGETAEEQRIFMKIVEDDDKFWFSSLQVSRAFLDECGRFCGDALRRSRDSGVITSAAVPAGEAPVVVNKPEKSTLVDLMAIVWIDFFIWLTRKVYLSPASDFFSKPHRLRF